MSKLNVLYQFNEKYAPYAGVSITSLFENNKQYEYIDVYILGEKLSNDSVEKLKCLAKKYRRNLIFKETENLILKMEEWGIPKYRGSYSANMRLFLPMILEEGVSRILYLDADTVVVGSVNELFDMEMNEYSLAMALDSLGGEHKKNIGINENDYYFNSGVILFEMNNWRKNELSQKIVAHIKDGNTHYPSPDQDLLNVVCKNNILPLDARYNMQPVHLVFKIRDYFKYYSCKAYYTKQQIEEAVNNVVVYHFFRFLGEFPWNAKNLHPDNRIFDYYLKKSPWSDYKKVRANNGLAMKMEKILYRILPKSLFLAVFCFAHNIYIEKNNEIF